MRTLLFILFLLSASFMAIGQKPTSPPPKTSPPPAPMPSSPPPPPPPPPSPTTGAGNTGSTGFRLLKIPAAGGYYLGMKRSEYDSVNRVSPVTINTGKGEYALKPSPLFTGSRLLMLSLSLDSSFSASPDDIAEMYRNKLGEPDSQQSTDTTWNLPDANNPSVKVDYAVKKTDWKWYYQYHDIHFSGIRVDMRNGSYRAVFTIRYTGNEIFRTLLKNLEEREGF